MVPRINKVADASAALLHILLFAADKVRGVTFYVISKTPLITEALRLNSRSLTLRRKFLDCCKQL